LAVLADRKSKFLTYLTLALFSQGGGGDFSAAEIATADVVYEIARGQRMRKK
jgi:hypothetical protein